MNKAELVSAMAEKAEVSKKDAEAALKAFTDVVLLTKNGDVNITSVPKKVFMGRGMATIIKASQDLIDFKKTFKN